MNEYIYEMDMDNVLISDEELMYVQCNNLLRHNRRKRTNPNWGVLIFNESEEI